MKKLISFLLIQVFLLSLCSCSAENSLPEQSETTEEVSSNPIETPATDQSETTIDTSSEENGVCLTQYHFDNLSDFYLYAESYEQDFSKYKNAPIESGSRIIEIPPYELLELVKVEDLFPTVNEGSFYVRSITLNYKDSYYYTCIYNHYEFYIKVRGKATIVGSEHWYTNPVITQTPQYDQLTLEGNLVAVEMKVSPDLFVTISFPNDKSFRQEITTSKDIPELVAIFSEDPNKIASVVGAVIQKIQPEAEKQ